MKSLKNNTFMENLTFDGANGSIDRPASIGMNVRNNELELTTVKEILENIKENKELERLVNNV